MAEKNLQKNIDFVKENKAKLLSQYGEKYIVIFEEEVQGSYDTYTKAVEEAISVYGQDADFLVYHLTSMESVNFVMRAVL